MGNLLIPARDGKAGNFVVSKQKVFRDAGYLYFPVSGHVASGRRRREHYGDPAEEFGLDSTEAAYQDVIHFWMIRRARLSLDEFSAQLQIARRRARASRAEWWRVPAGLPMDIAHSECWADVESEVHGDDEHL